MCRNTRCWALLFAHAAGFAALNAGGCLQHILPQDEPLDAYYVVFGFAFFIIILFWITRLFRHHWLHTSAEKANCELPGEATRASRASSGQVRPTDNVFHHEHEHHENHRIQGPCWCLHLWDEETYDAEEDIAGLAISFLFVQAIRFNCSGHLPNNFGVEEKKAEYMHDMTETFKLAICALLFLIGLYMTIYLKDVPKRYFGHGACGKLVSRTFGAWRKAFSMGFAWCILYLGMHREAKILQAEAPWTITERMILAFILSVFAFALIFLFDLLEHSGAASGAKAQEFIHEIIVGLSLLVGFSWEQCFDRAVEVVALTLKKRASINPETSQIVMAFLLCAIVVTPWRRVILATQMAVEKQVEGEEEGDDDDEPEDKQEKKFQTYQQAAPYRSQRYSRASPFQQYSSLGQPAALNPSRTVYAGPQPQFSQQQYVRGANVPQTTPGYASQPSYGAPRQVPVSEVRSVPVSTGYTARSLSPSGGPRQLSPSRVTSTRL